MHYLQIKWAQMTRPSVLTAPSRVPSGYMLCLGDRQTAVGLQFPQSKRDPPLQHLLLGSLSGRLLAAPDYLMVPSQLERRGWWVGGREEKKGDRGSLSGVWDN